MFKARLKYKKSFIDGYFIDLNGNIYDHNGVKQPTYINQGYQMFKGYKVHQMMVHSFYGYKPGFDIHHKNQIKTDNSLDNLLYLTPSEHARLHKIGVIHSEESKQKMSEAHLGKIHSEQTKQKMSDSRLGKTFSEEHKQKIRDSQAKKRVRCLESGIIYQSIHAASRDLHIHQPNLSKHLNKKRNSVTGLHFQFVL